MEGSIAVRVAGERLVLLPERALWWPDASVLFLADVHFGKAAAFRASAVPVPGGSTTHDCARISRLLEATGASRLVVLGDLWHARAGLAPETLKAVREWRESWPSLSFELVVGNHDQRTGVLPDYLDVQERSEGSVEGPFVLAHQPCAAEGGYVLSGHLHPSFCLETRAEAVRLPCFWFSPACGVLPAFGSFTGSAAIRPEAEDYVAIIAEGRVHRVPLA